jgi:FtsP/CotA-like multicopper oxidase with cupredoxin domain
VNVTPAITFVQPVARSGQSSLVTGSVVVADPAVTAGTRIRLVNAGAAGTLGILSYTRQPGVSFTIVSTNALDTSAVFWEVVSY